MPPLSPTSDEESLQIIQKAMVQRQYEKAIEITNSFLLNALEMKNEDQLANCLEIYDAICDKTPVTIEFTLSHIGELLDNPEYWVRQEALTILRKIFRSVHINKFDPIIESIEAKLFDADKKVRESAVSLISVIMERSLDYYPDLYLTYSQMFADDSWRVRAKALEGLLEFLKPDIAPPPKLLSAIKSNIFKLIRDPDEEIRGLTTEAIKALSYHLSGPEMVDLILPILSDIDWEIREKGIWIVGEVGPRFYDHFDLIFHKLVAMFADAIMMIQTKTIDTFVKVGKIHGKKLLYFFRDILEENVLSKDIIEGIMESTIFFTLQNIREMLPLLIKELNNPFQKFRDFVGDCLIKIYMEKSDAFEEELARMYQSLDPENWRQRKTTIKLLGDLSYILHIHSVAMWTVINLQNWKKEEKDFDVLDEIDISLTKIKNIFEDIDKDIIEIEKQKQEFYENLDRFQRYVQTMRIETENLVSQNRFQQAELYMEKESKSIAEKLNDSEEILNRSKFKRFSVEVIQDFKEIKDEVLDNISDVKYLMKSRIAKGRDAYLVVLKEQIEILINRINQLKLQFDQIKKYDTKIGPEFLQERPEDAEKLLEEISSVRKQLYDLEFEIGQIWMKNLEFKDALKEVTLFWVDVKIEIQQYLALTLSKFEEIQAKIKATEGEHGKLKKKISFDFLTSNLQSIVLQAVQNVQDMLETFSKVSDPIYQNLEKRQFKSARNLLAMTINNIQNSITEYDTEIHQIYAKIQKFDYPPDVLEELQRYIAKWEQIQQKLDAKLAKFNAECTEDIWSSEIHEFLTYMNPLSLSQLSQIYDMDIADLRSSIFNLIKDHKLKAEIRNNTIVQPSRPLGESFLELQKKIEIVGSKIFFNLRITNPTTLYLNDMSIVFFHPQFLKLNPAMSDPLEVVIRDFEPESTRIIHWEFKLEKAQEKHYSLNKWLLNVTYKNPFGKFTTLKKEMEIIL